MSERLATWTCEVSGTALHADLPDGSDLPMRKAVRAAFLAVTGTEETHLSSGWGRAHVVLDPEPPAAPSPDLAALRGALERGVLLPEPEGLGWDDEVRMSKRDFHEALNRHAVGRVSAALTSALAATPPPAKGSVPADPKPDAEQTVDAASFRTVVEQRDFAEGQVVRLRSERDQARAGIAAKPDAERLDARLLEQAWHEHRAKVTFDHRDAQDCWPENCAQDIATEYARMHADGEPDDESGHSLDIDCWCRPYRDTIDPNVIIHRKAGRA